MSVKSKRILMSFAGVIISAISVAIFKVAAFGVDPFQSFMSGMDALIPIPFGTLYVLVNGILLFFALFTNRRLIGIATFINMFLLGYITEFTYAELQLLWPEPSMALRCLCLIVGIVVICMGGSLYMTADLGVSTYDAVAIVMANQWKIAKFQYCRVGTDLVCVLLGCMTFLISGGKLSQLPTIAGVGTIITAFFMGPLIELFNRKLSRPLLEK